MIEYKTGDLLAEDVEALVNTVNCVGIMGRGVALQFKNKYPSNFKSYEAACKREEVQPGRMFVVETNQMTNPRYIINFPTKRHWRANSRMSDIESGLVGLVDEIKERNIRSIALPPLGSGNGGLDWADVLPRIERAMQQLPDVRVVIFEPQEGPAPALNVTSREVPSITTGRASIVGLMHFYLAGLMDPFVTLLEVHKLMYFMQEAGEPLKLSYVKGRYGPYAENLRHALSAIEGHLISGYADAGDAPGKELQLVPGAVPEAKAFLEQHPATRQRIRRVFDLVKGFETPFGLELLSTVHWVIRQQGANTAESIVELTYAWGDRKRQFSESQIRLATDVLSKQGWIDGDGPPDRA